MLVEDRSLAGLGGSFGGLEAPRRGLGGGFEGAEPADPLPVHDRRRERGGSGWSALLDRRASDEGRSTPMLADDEAPWPRAPPPPPGPPPRRSRGSTSSGVAVDEDDEEKDSPSSAIHRAITVGRERAVALAEARLASARAAGATSHRLVELLGDLAAAHAGVGVGGLRGVVGGAAAATAPTSPPPSASRALALALSLLDPRDVGDWRASKPSALAALASGRFRGATSTASLPSPPSPSLSDFLNDLRVRFSVGPSKGTTVSLAEMLTKPPSWFVATMADLGAANSQALAPVVGAGDPSAVLRGPWLSSRRGQRGLREAARLFSQLRTLSPVWVATDVASALDLCSLLGFAPEEGAGANKGTERGADADDGDSMNVDVDGDDGDRVAAAAAAAAAATAPDDDDAIRHVRLGLDAMRLSAEQRRSVLGIRRDYLRVRRAAAIARARAVSELRSLLLLPPPPRATTSPATAEATADGSGGDGTNDGADAATAAAATPQNAPPPSAANDIGRDAYARALRAASELSRAAAAEAEAETHIAVRICSIVTRAQGGLYNAIAYPRPHCVSAMAELIAAEAGEAPAEAVLAGAVVV